MTAIAVFATAPRAGSSVRSGRTARLAARSSPAPARAHGITDADASERLYLVAGNEDLLRVPRFPDDAAVQPGDLFVMAILVAAPRGDAAMYRRLVVGGLLAFFLPPFIPVGEWAYRLVARNRYQAVGEQRLRRESSLNVSVRQKAIRGPGNLHLPIVSSPKNRIAAAAGFVSAMKTRVFCEKEGRMGLALNVQLYACLVLCLTRVSR